MAAFTITCPQEHLITIVPIPSHRSVFVRMEG
jgi:hypothetical protein